VNKRVLVVDDDRPIREVVRTILSRQGYEVDEAADGRQAMRKVIDDNYGAIVLDLMLPEMSGYEVIDYLTRERPTSKCVVVISAAPSREIEKVDPSIVQAVLRKPFDISDLVKAVGGCFNGKETGTGGGGI
jgi:DNA-binding response OmpR family regulator